MIVFDTETTGLVGSHLLPKEKQPKIIEIYAAKLDDVTLEQIDELDLLIDPGELISEEITGITSITNDMVKGKGRFAEHFQKIADFWLGEKIDVGHNIAFDLDMMTAELRRMGKIRAFPWAMNHLCTVELSEHYEGRRMKLADLYEYLTGEKFEGAHRARADVQGTATCLREIAKRGDMPKF